jgi:Cytochrome C'
MTRSKLLRAGLAITFLLLLGSGAVLAQRIVIVRPTRTPPAPNPAPVSSTAPKFEALAETRLLMEGLALANYRGLTKQLKERPADNDTWAFARGQALLLGETGNLLMLRPPRNEGREAWMKLSAAMRDAAGELAKSAGTRDYETSKTRLRAVAETCNRCHATFRIPVRIGDENSGGE